MNIFYMILVIAAVIFFMIIPLARMLILDVYPYMKDASSQEKALQKGVVTNADIITAMQTTMWTGSKSLFKLKLRVKTENG